jgi:hypothetical protein
MKELELSRRTILSGIAVAGGTGSLVGSATGAILTDRETFAGNTLQTSENVGGVVDLNVSLEPLDEGTGVRYLYGLPDDVNNNPSYIWLRTSVCPEPVELAEAITVELRIECAGGETTIATGSALDVLNELRTGTLLCAGDEPCLQAGEVRQLELEVVSVDSDYTGPPGPLEFQFEFYGQQCRYNGGTESPWGPDDIIEECGGDGDGGQHAISFIAFCAPTDPDPADIVIPDDVNDTDDAGDPTSVDWATSSDVTYVVVKAANYWSIYDYSEVTKTSGVAASQDPDADWSGYIDPSGGSASVPCEIAANKLGDGTFSGTSTKFEYLNGEFVEESGGGN